MKDFVVFTKKLANKLTQEGFEVVKTAVNNEKPQYYVYYFKDTPELREAIKRLSK